MTLDSMADLRRALVQHELIDAKQLRRIVDEIDTDNPDRLIEVLQHRSILTPYQVDRLRQGEQNGYIIGNYKILYLISAGAFGEVFRAEDRTDGSAVALKVLRDEYRCDDVTVRNFYREAELTKDFDHPHIVRLLSYGLDQESNRHYIALEFIEGGSIREFLRVRGKVEPLEVLRLGIEMVDGLRYALEKGITHRDIKATNILLTGDGHVKWIDFGLGGVVLGDEKYSVEQRTVDYAGLEKATSVPEGDPRSDIYFLGLIIFEMLAGRKAISDPDAKADRLHRNRFKDVRTLTGNKNFPESLTAIIDHMTRFLPYQRYSNYDDILKEMREARRKLELELSGAEPEPEPPRVMVVHKSAKTRGLLKAKLPELGYQVVLMENLDRAMTIFKIKPPDCLVLDLDSIEREALAGSIRIVAAAGNCPILFLVSSGQKEWIPLDHGCKIGLVKKPLQLGPLYLGLKKLKAPARGAHDLKPAPAAPSPKEPPAKR